MKKSILIAGVLMAASIVQAEVLSWSVDLPGGNTYATAQLFATEMTGGAYYADLASSQSTKIAPFNPFLGVFPVDTLLNVGSSYNFYVMLFDADLNPLSYSDLRTWVYLEGIGALVSGATPGVPSSSPWGITSVTAVPEPTSMALLALGVSAMLLRRKRTV